MMVHAIMMDTVMVLFMCIHSLCPCMLHAAALCKLPKGPACGDSQQQAKGEILERAGKEMEYLMGGVDHMAFSAETHLQQ